MRKFVEKKINVLHVLLNFQACWPKELFSDLAGQDPTEIQREKCRTRRHWTTNKCGWTVYTVSRAECDGHASALWL